MQRWELIHEQCRFRGLVMCEKDLSELYTYLELFHKTFTTCDQEVSVVLQAVKELYILYTGEQDENLVFKALRNPRGAGRKKKYDQAAKLRVKELSARGLSIRGISQELNISKSTIQRMLHS